MTSAQLAILGLLVEQSLHLYAIKGLVEQRGIGNWTPIGLSSIHQILEQLVDAGWTEAEVEPAPGRGKEWRAHHVTPEGRRHWEAKAMWALVDVESDPSTFLLALSDLPLLDQAAVAEALTLRVAHLESRMADLNRDLATARPAPTHVEAMFDYTRSRIACERDWVRTYVTTLTTNPRNGSS